MVIFVPIPSAAIFTGLAPAAARRRIDPEEGKTWQWLGVGGLAHSLEQGMLWEDAVVGWDGLLYTRTLKYIARFNPDRFPTTGPITLGADNEMPFDYGVERHNVNRKGEESPQAAPA